MKKEERLKTEQGSTLVEYVLLVCMIALAALTALPKVGQAVSTKTSEITTILDPAWGGGEGGENDETLGEEVLW